MWPNSGSKEAQVREHLISDTEGQARPLAIKALSSQTYGQLLEPCATELLRKSKALPWVWEDVLGGSDA